MRDLRSTAHKVVLLILYRNYDSFLTESSGKKNYRTYAELPEYQ